MFEATKFIQVFLMSYNRKDFLAESLKSLLKQQDVNFEVIISDNSTDETVFRWFKENYPTPPINLKYIRRKQSLPVLDHHNQIISEATAPYFMMFHDDDILRPGALKTLLHALEANPKAAAASSNAGLIYEQTSSQELFNPHLSEDITFETPEDFTEHYLIPEKGHTPFPGYLYRTSLVKNIKMNFKQGRKNADVSFLIKTCMQGPIIWLSTCTMDYRRHGNNGSISIDIKAVFSLCRFLKKATHTPENLIQTYKFKHCYLWLKQSQSDTALSIHRRKILKLATYVYLFRHPQIILKSLLRRLQR